VDESAAAGAAEAIGRAATPTALDVADAAACERLAAEAAAGEGGLAVWVNSAGILRTAPSWEHSEAERRAMFDVNAHGLMNGTLAALGPMRQAGRGHVINLISLAGLAAPPGETVYAASKHAALAFSLGTLYDLREAGIDHVHVSSVCPDGVWTPMLFDKVDDPHAAPSWSGVMLEPGSDPAEVAWGRRPCLRGVPRPRRAAGAAADGAGAPPPGRVGTPTQPLKYHKDPFERRLLILSRAWRRGGRSSSPTRGRSARSPTRLGSS
jgi:NAD(P)-dependent dehydrogenase (short-subunit alcohol dehydrogenase family)